MSEAHMNLQEAGRIAADGEAFFCELRTALIWAVLQLRAAEPKTATPRADPYMPRKEICRLRREAISEYLGGWKRSPPLSEIKEHLKDVVGIPASKGTIASDLRAMGVTNPRAWRYTG